MKRPAALELLFLRLPLPWPRANSDSVISHALELARERVTTATALRMRTAKPSHLPTVCSVPSDPVLRTCHPESGLQRRRRQHSVEALSWGRGQAGWAAEALSPTPGLG